MDWDWLVELPFDVASAALLTLWVYALYVALFDRKRKSDDGAELSAGVVGNQPTEQKP